MRIILAIIGLIFIKPFLLGAFVGYSIGWALEKMIFTPTQSKKRGSVSLDLRVKLLILAMKIAKVDGNILKTERIFIRNYFTRVYGPDEVDRMFRTVRENPKYLNLSSEQIAKEFQMKFNYGTRTTILHLLFEVANADGLITSPELIDIQKISYMLGISRVDYMSIKAMFFQNKTEVRGSYYTILGINRNATTQEIKKAYRTMAKKYHPDLIKSDDQAIKKSASEKFRQINEAYEGIKKERGI